MGLLCYNTTALEVEKSFLIRDSFKIKRNRLLNNKSFIDKAYMVMMAEYWLLSFSPFFPLTVKVHKKRKKERSRYSIILFKNLSTLSVIYLHFHPTKTCLEVEYLRKLELTAFILEQKETIKAAKYLPSGWSGKRRMQIGTISLCL